jgi:hypothetical protein
LRIATTHHLTIGTLLPRAFPLTKAIGELTTLYNFATKIVVVHMASKRILTVRAIKPSRTVLVKPQIKRCPLNNLLIGTNII